ncbi:hypothetical protein V1478_005414 [Vespula squamosa]|uniref:Uncharacterized protein n=1 Tax=Vespula squamosa TaxID=30214 RepID=A0ABD2BE38_VESSQ
MTRDSTVTKLHLRTYILPIHSFYVTNSKENSPISFLTNRTKTFEESSRIITKHVIDRQGEEKLKEHVTHDVEGVRAEQPSANLDARLHTGIDFPSRSFHAILKARDPGIF